MQLPHGSFDVFHQACQTTTFTLGVGLPGRIWLSHEVEKIDDLSAAKNFPRWKVAQDCGLHSGFGIPLLANNSILGVFEFFSETSIELSQAELETFLTLGSQIGQFILQKQAEYERERLANIVQYSNDAIFTRSEDEIITSWNRGAELLLGYSADEAIGQKISLLLPPGKKLEVPAGSVNQRIDDYETQRVTKGGQVIDVSISWSPLFAQSGAISGCSVNMRDISARKEAERRVSEFYSVVSHELRTPLTSIRGALGLLEGGIVEVGSDEGRELIEVARVSADRLIRLINDMLDLKKIEVGKMELHKTKVDVKELVSETLFALTGMARDAGIRLLDLSQEGRSVYADMDKATQILTNLVSNAVKFSPKDSQVSVVTHITEQERIRFGVVDNGPGISEQDLHKLFDKFQQLDSSDTRLQGGTGLGLAISKALVAEHKGAIGVESTPGQGSTFWFELPIYMEAGAH